MNRNKLFQKLYSVIMAVILLAQLLTPIAQIDANDQVSTNADTVKLIDAKQDDNQQGTLALKIHTKNTGSTTTQAKVKATSNEGLVLKNTDKETTLTDTNNKEVGQYTVKDNQLDVTVNAGVDSDAILKLAFQSSTSNTSGTLKFTLNSQSITSETLQTANSSASTSSSSSSSSAQTSSSSAALTSSASSKTSSVIKSSSSSSSQSAASSQATASSAAKESSTAANKTTKTLAAATTGNDLSKYLPDSSNGTIIDSAEIEFTDQNGKTVDSSAVTADTNIKLNYKWSILKELKDGYQLKAGDYFSFNLPAGIQYKPGTGKLGDYGTYTISSDGKVTFTFNQEVESHDSISGTFNYTSTISSSTTTGEQVITIPTKDGPHETQIVVNPTGGNDIAKAGKLTGETNSKNPTGITWDVTVNTNGKELDNATVTDPMPTSTNGDVPTTLKSTAVYPLTVDLKGNVTATGAPLTAGTDYTVDKNGKVTFIGKYAKTHQAFKIEYTSEIDASKLPDDGGSVNFTNIATLTNNGKDSTGKASVTANYGKLLNKTYDGQDNNGSQKYNWHIEYNYGEKKLPANTSLTDTLSAGQAFSGDPTLKYEDGTQVDASLYKVSYNSDKSKMTITFTNGLDKGVKIAYQSQVTDPIDKNQTISNSVSGGDKTADSGNQTVGQQGLTKSRGNVDYNAKTVQWNFDINMARQEMSNWSLTDPVPEGLTVDYNSLVLRNKDTNTTYKAGTDYLITKNGNGFKIEFLGSLKTSAKDWYTLSYKTSFETNKLPSNGKWTNTATATWKDKDGKDHTNNGSADFGPQTNFKNDGSKSGSYNAVNKHITWTVVGNYNQRTLKNASITDPIKGDQDYVDGSAKLYEATINASGSYTKGNEVTNATINYNKDSKTITAALPEGSTKAYVLVYETSLAGKVIDQKTYNNTATYTNDSKSSNLNASVAVPNSGSLATKSGQQDPTDSAYAIWNIMVNKAQSQLKDVVVDDTPSENQIVDEKSVVIYPTKVDAKGNYTEDTANPLQLNKDYKVDLTTDALTGKQELKISFLNEITSAYSVHYRSLINSGLANDTLSNSVTVAGNGEKETSQTTTSQTQIVNNGGSATGKNTNLVINKTDADNKKALAGAGFELYADNSGKKGQLLRSGTTGTDGKLGWNNLKSGKYILVETSAPDGYVISSDLAEGKEITISYANADANSNVTINEKNTQGKVTIQKTDSDTTKPLSGATFDLYKKDGSLVKGGLTSNDKGEVTYSGLDAGDYYIVEKTAPAGYDLDQTQHKFTVNADNIQQTVKAYNAEKTGAVVLTKTDGDTNKSLPGATFDLYKADGTKVASDLKTDSNGQISYAGLKPGDYYFTETAAPAGYDFNKDTHYGFTVELQTTAKVAKVAAVNSEKTGSVVLTKTDGDTGKVLSGAIFSLYDSNDKLIKTGLATGKDGQVKVDNLKPGNYYFKETKAPTGYELNDAKLSFTVELQTTVKVATVSATNAEKTGSVVLTKTDSDTGKTLSGAVFDLYKKDGTKIASGLTTDAAGQVKVAELKPGDYYFKETSAPAGYELNDAKLNFTVELQTTVKVATVSATNAEKTGSVVLTKTDSDTGKTLSGAVFDLYKKDGTKVASGLTTDAAGQIKVGSLKPGDYYFKETSAPAGYELNDTKLNFTVELQTTAKVATVSATNAEKTGSVVLTKTDGDTGKALAGATFDLYKADGTKVASGLTTDAAGQIKVAELKPGNYYFKETSAPAGYELNNAKLNFTVELQTTVKVATVSATNAEKAGSVVLTKTDGDTGKALPGATFDLYKADGTKLETGLTTVNNGQIKVDNLKPGDYYFKETSAPAGYELNDAKLNFTVELQTTVKVATVSATNAEKTGSVVLTKTDGDTGKVLARATFDLYNSNDKLIKEGLTTDKNGQIKVDNLKPGNYYFKETAAPAGYDFNKDTHYGFTVELQVTTRVAAVSVKNAEKTGSVVLTKTDSDTGKTLSGAVFDLYKKDGTKIASGLTTDAAGQVKVAELKPGDYYFKETSAPAGYELNDAKLNFTVELQTTVKVATVSATNAEKTGSVVLTKTDSDTGKTLSGAVFDLYKKDGTKVASGLTTDAAGQINVAELKPGQYYFVETSAPAGYSFDIKKQYSFTIVLNQQHAVTVKATNTEKTGSVVLTKTDGDTGKALSGAVFDLYKKDGTKVASGLTTDVKGQVKYNNLKLGKYYFVEVKAPKGYDLNKDKQTFRITLRMTEKSIPANVQVTDKKTPVQPEKPENPTQSSSSKPRTGTSGL